MFFESYPDQSIALLCPGGAIVQVLKAEQAEVFRLRLSELIDKLRQGNQLKSLLKAVNELAYEFASI
ncbi:hypothetical protein [Leptolyngbya sp. FACHB-261]|uniref:hypothetical protein n=1 Tax=Leptolyngbya sp. FACHB-261 TaxID=2692806 RepID=UPI00168259AF|nr:hypothetical protein [Leptolyngbya sp. FACHB-261]MBD2103636.1 hypothetical protein [Leptolyngbya sp. FACHB-261]